ncbi:MAG: hydroxyacylglutathione hydrolase, partial [Candidatus Aegiribacteria sp.]|nr:hydroxyacylglutathione hydrolase [Candidatus Aegiribacteria sp.]MBD3294621.1 hydroxyacylglutathione hydrolase [Candidatus Fermentibacteria bacterium]
MEIFQFRYSADNLGYLVCGERKALAVDGGAAADILEFLG